MKTFNQIVKEYTTSSGKIKRKQIVEYLKQTTYWNSFIHIKNQFPKLPITAYIYIMQSGERPTCKHPECSNYTKWSYREGKNFWNYCSSKCQNSDPAKIKKQSIAYTKGQKKRAKSLSQMRKQYKSEPITKLSKKHIKEFQKLIPDFTREWNFVKYFPEHLKRIWFNLPWKTIGGKKLMATGQIPLEAWCPICGNKIKKINVFLQRWNTGCSVLCSTTLTLPDRCSPEAIDKMAQTIRKKFKDSNFKKKVYEATVQGLQRKYGKHVTNASQIPEVARKMHASLTRSKEFQLGKRVVKVQGFEPQALRLLLTKYKSSEIKVFSEGKVPHIKYKNNEGKISIHYPDIFIKKENRLVEVKSTYTLLMTEKGWENLKLKRKEAIKQGYLYSLLIMTAKGTIKYIPKNWYLFSYTQMKSWLKNNRV